ncbi:uncharacterized protein LOC121784258 [Salvia splendens]|uniref:uncharacterized protein LOC121784258 n=1 Tax=Salvia splendens TaxID=180675 RepID=UPI001C2735F5|nr:uncharacterized protein LOC121784258 [Salvia splendens]
MADIVRDNQNPNEPHVFEPNKIKNISFASVNNGVPAIYFSGVDTRQLAENMGNAVVGKFSHSIPASHQIQKALDNIKFSKGMTWKYINAKHILIQFDDIADYARMLGGPKGTPIWYVDRHSMRVFKWSPDFDVYCESPIAAIWCNLIALPIHLFDTAALFAIEKLLGTPIQIDKATAAKSRLSFARICIEIDITKPPPEEIILDICGREIIQQIKWDKIPAYCLDCKHVGHTKEVCYANGRTGRPMKRNYHTMPPPGMAQGEKTRFNNGNQQTDKTMKPNQEGNTNSLKLINYQKDETPSAHQPDIMGNFGEAEYPDQDFQVQGRRRQGNQRRSLSPGYKTSHGARKGAT